MGISLPKLSRPSSFPLLLCVFSVHLHLMCIKCWSYLTMGIYQSFLILSTSFLFVHFCAHSHLMCIKCLSYLTMGLYQSFLNRLLLSFFLYAFCVHLHLVYICILCTFTSCIECSSYLTIGIYWTFLILSTSLWILCVHFVCIYMFCVSRVLYLCWHGAGYRMGTVQCSSAIRRPSSNSQPA